MNGKGDKVRSGANRDAYRRGWDEVFSSGSRQACQAGARVCTPRPRVYISGPITLGSRQFNLEQALFAHRDLLDTGFAPLNPILTMLIPWEGEVQHDVWLEADVPWVEVADALLRLPGTSVGADREVEHARECGVPVFFNLRDLKEYFYGEPT